MRGAPVRPGLPPAECVLVCGVTRGVGSRVYDEIIHTSITLQPRGRPANGERRPGAVKDDVAGDGRAGTGTGTHGGGRPPAPSGVATGHEASFLPTRDRETAATHARTHDTPG
ncbi:hypothetical protein ZWY2020_018315 [Hordeum vulgare]|nr:hypothetical protein ZWY2020_018315 [Hordeum vulgare]